MINSRSLSKKPIIRFVFLNGWQSKLDISRQWRVLAATICFYRSTSCHKHDLAELKHLSKFTIANAVQGIVNDNSISFHLIIILEPIISIIQSKALRFVVSSCYCSKLRILWQEKFMMADSYIVVYWTTFCSCLLSKFHFGIGYKVNAYIWLTLLLKRNCFYYKKKHLLSKLS